MTRVRSFDNQRSETIQFYAPLTLIVGYNGSGKTTIIECLKYATTGELPPNSKGGAFIHDPKICGEKEVLAQVKLSFTSTSGAKMVASRRLQLTVKKTARSVKALESQLLMIKDGERTSLSSRVAELSLLMPQYLGVSKAILEYVIFCHQDESLWPMAAPAELKKRFDEIFEALKYTRAVDNIKVLRKAQHESLGKLKIVEQHAKEDKDKGERAEKKSHELFDEIETLRVKSEGLGEKIGEAKEKYDEAWARISRLSDIVGQLSGKRIEQRAKQENVQKLRRNLKELTDSDEELQAMLEKYEDRVETLNRSVHEQTDTYSDLRKELQQTRDGLGAKEREMGSYEAQKLNYERQVGNREQLVKQTARQHNIRGFDLDVNDEQVRLFIERVSRLARDQSAAFERARRETQDELQRAQKVLNRINEQKSKVANQKENARSSAAANERKTGNLQTELNRVDVDEGGKVALESSIEDVEARLRHAKSDFDKARWTSQVEEADVKIRSLDDQKEKLDSELIEGTKRAGDTAQLDYLHAQHGERQRSLKTMVGAHGGRIGEVVGGDVEPATIEGRFGRTLDESNKRLAEVEKQHDGLSRELEQVDFKLKTCRADLTRKRQELHASEKTIRDATDEDPADYPAQLSQAQENRDVLRSDVDSFEHLKDYYSKCMETAKSDHVCRMCRRGFGDDTKAYNAFIKLLSEQLKKHDAAAVANDLADAETELNSVKAASGAYDTWKRLAKTEIPALEASETTIKASHDGLTTDIEQQDGLVQECRLAKQDVESVSANVQKIAKYHAEIGALDKQIKELSTKQESAGLLRGLEQIQEDIKAINDQSRSMRTSLVKMTGERDRARGSITTMELELRDVRSKLTNAIHQLKEKAAVDKQINELKSLNLELRDSLRKYDQDLQAFGPEMSEAQAKYDDIARRGAERDQQLREETSSLNNSLNKLQMADREVSGYSDRGGPQQLASAKSAIDNMKKEVSRVEASMTKITKEVKLIETQLRDHETTKRSICDNQDFRRDKRGLEGLGAQIKELESHNAEVDKDRYEREGNRWEMERNKLTAEQASLMGQLKSKDDHLQQLLSDWETEYKDAAYKYKEAHIKVETTKAAVEDLGRYGGALDKAIMKYHSLKMEEINRIAEELWKKTYQGTDVDTILIRSENEKEGGNKSYNYRVCMVKQDAEMDMRGRCSAGQKVLASIIIRLALAECFGVNCGLIALDEPTTNLDRDNIRALAESLAEIIRVRRQQRNFQLIVITHDEEFLRFMQCADFADFYYRVSRNERQKSIIERQSIAEVL